MCQLSAPLSEGVTTEITQMQEGSTSYWLPSKPPKNGRGVLETSEPSVGCKQDIWKPSTQIVARSTLLEG